MWGIISRNNIMNSEFNIVDFPVEIIEHIFSFIKDTQGYASFRQSCWYIYNCTKKVKKFFPSGKLNLSIPVSKNQINGHVLGHHINGSLRFLGLFVKNKREGYHKYFYSDNKMMFSGNYLNNLRRGYHFWYHSTGALERFNYYIDDKKHGKEVSYHPDGSFRWIINYDNNKIVGRAVFYKDTFDNLKYLDIPIKNGEVNGLIVIYNFNGFIKYQGYVRDGVPIGTHKHYYNNGHIKRITEFKNGKLNGFVKEFYSNGSLMSIVKYRNNLKDSRENVWHNKRGLKTSVRYEKNKKQGVFLKYNFLGELDKKCYLSENAIEGSTSIYTKTGRQFQSLNGKVDVLINYIDNKLSTVFFRNDSGDVSNSQSYFLNGIIKNKTYNDRKLKSNFHYNMFGELTNETIIIQNFIKSIKTQTSTEDPLVNACLEIPDKSLLLPI